MERPRTKNHEEHNKIEYEIQRKKDKDDGSNVSLSEDTKQLQGKVIKTSKCL